MFGGYWERGGVVRDCENIAHIYWSKIKCKNICEIIKLKSVYGKSGKHTRSIMFCEKCNKILLKMELFEIMKILEIVTITLI